MILIWADFLVGSTWLRGHSGAINLWTLGHFIRVGKTVAKTRWPVRRTNWKRLSTLVVHWVLPWPQLWSRLEVRTTRWMLSNLGCSPRIRAAKPVWGVPCCITLRVRLSSCGFDPGDFCMPVSQVAKAKERATCLGTAFAVPTPFMCKTPWFTPAPWVGYIVPGVAWGPMSWGCPSCQFVSVIANAVSIWSICGAFAKYADCGNPASWLAVLTPGAIGSGVGLLTTVPCNHDQHRLEGNQAQYCKEPIYKKPLNSNGAGKKNACRGYSEHSLLAFCDPLTLALSWNHGHILPLLNEQSQLYEMESFVATLCSDHLVGRMIIYCSSLSTARFLFGSSKLSSLGKPSFSWSHQKS